MFSIFSVLAQYMSGVHKSVKKSQSDPKNKHKSSEQNCDARPLFHQQQRQRISLFESVSAKRAFQIYILSAQNRKGRFCRRQLRHISAISDTDLKIGGPLHNVFFS